MKTLKMNLIMVTMLFGLISFSFSFSGVIGRVQQPGSNYNISKESFSKNNIYGKEFVTKSIQSEDGDVIDCIDIWKQPAFNHPALKNHKIQMKPNLDPKIKTSEAEARKENAEKIVTSQKWHRRGIACPAGTIPIRRIRKFKNFRKNYNPNLLQANRSTSVLTAIGYSYTAAKGNIRVWNPYVETDDEYSTSQVTLRNGPLHAYEQVESGWAVNPSVYGDHQTRFFAYWTADSSNTTGCFDHTCPGFVQTNKDIALGAAIHPISMPNGLPSIITIYIYKDFLTHNWWLEYERTTIGYWPAELFKVLWFQANLVQWGGEVYSSRVGVRPHTKTAMGSGQFSDPTGHWITSGQITRMRVQENGHELKFPEYVWGYSEEVDCYDWIYVGDYILDPEFYYGGPGRNWRCP